MWTKNIQMYKLDLEKAKEPEIKLPASVGSLKKQGNSRKISTSDSLTTLNCSTGWITINCGTFLKRWEYHITLPDLGNLYEGQEATVRTGHGKMDWFKIRKGVCQGYILSLYLFNLYAECIMGNGGLDEAQAGIKTAWGNINNLRYADDTICRKWRGTKEPLDESERGE